MVGSMVGDGSVSIVRPPGGYGSGASSRDFGPTEDHVRAHMDGRRRRDASGPREAIAEKNTEE